MSNKPWLSSSILSSCSPNCWTSTLAAMRRMDAVPESRPFSQTAMTKSANTVSTVMVRIATSARGARRTMLAKCFTSLMFQATTNRMAERRGQRNVRGQRREKHDGRDQCQGMRNSRQRTCPAVTDVVPVGNRAGSRKTAEEWGHDIRQPLADEFLIGIVFGARHAVGHHRRKQRLDGAQHGNREGGAEQLDDAGRGRVRQMETRQPLRNSPKALPIVATPSKWKIDCSAVTATMATSGPGTRCKPRKREENITSSKLRMERASSPDAIAERPESGSSFWWKCTPPTAGNPKKSFHCPTKMITPIPAVNPTITGMGMN